MGIRTVAVYSTADKDSLHVKFADEAVCIGPPPVHNPVENTKYYCCRRNHQCDAIHPGYGFLSENANFSRICIEHKIKFIGALPEQIDAMGDKASLKKP